MIERKAIFSDDRRYRYRLERRWSDEPGTATWVMLNPSTADDEKDDPTIRRCIGFSSRERCGRLVVVNLYGLVTPDPSLLFAPPAPGGPRLDLMGENLAYLKQAVKGAELYRLIVAWGALGSTVPGIRVTAKWLASAGAQCLGLTKSGHPRYPLYLRMTEPLEPFTGQLR